MESVNAMMKLETLLLLGFEGQQSQTILLSALSKMYENLVIYLTENSLCSVATTDTVINQLNRHGCFVVSLMLNRLWKKGVSLFSMQHKPTNENLPA